MIAKLIDEIGEDADLLTYSDEWLEHQRICTSQKIDELLCTLQSIIAAQRIKTILQDRNMVPVQQIERDDDGNLTNIYLCIMNLPEALSLIKSKQIDTYDALNKATQHEVWRQDRYDLNAYDD